MTSAGVERQFDKPRFILTEGQGDSEDEDEEEDGGSDLTEDYEY
jgi:hypothetical protein